MSSNIKVQRICKYCGNEFTARTTTTLYCSKKCNSHAYKGKIKSELIEASNKETLLIKTKPIEELKAKEFLTVRNVATLLNCSVRTIYFYIETGTIKAVNLSERKTIIKRSDIDKLFEQPQPENKPEQKQPEISECYNLNEVKRKYSISDKALHELIKRNRIQKIKQGRFTYVPKTDIDKILS